MGSVEEADMACQSWLVLGLADRLPGVVWELEVLHVVEVEFGGFSPISGRIVARALLA